MKKHFMRTGTLLLVAFMMLISAASVFAQTDSSAKTDFPGLINGLGLSQEQSDKTMKLTKDFLIALQEANQNLTNLMNPPAPGSPADPKSSEKISLIQRQFGIKLEQYHLELADSIGDEKALKVVEYIHGIIPQVLLQGSGITAGGHDAHGLPTGTDHNSMASNGVNSNPNNMPMDNMPGMNMNVTENTTPSVNVAPNVNMPNMNSMPLMNGNQPISGTGPDAINRQILAQLQSSNAMLIQMLAGISRQPNSGILQAQIQPIYQMLASQSVLIQMLYSNLNNGSMNMNSGSINGMGMGNNNKMGMGDMNGMGMMGK